MVACILLSEGFPWGLKEIVGAGVAQQNTRDIAQAGQSPDGPVE